MNKTGYIYIITNPAWENWVKIGITDNLDKRLQTYQTCDPYRAYKIEYFIKIDDYKKIEKLLEETMKPFAKKQLNEWYEIDKKSAIVRLQEFTECQP